MNDNSSPAGATGWVAMPLWVLRETDLPANAVLVLLALLGRTNATGVCWPSHQTIAADAHVSPSTVKRALEALRSAGLVTWTVRQDDASARSSNLYRVHVERPVAPATKAPVQSELPPWSN